MKEKSIMGSPPIKAGKITLLYAQWLDTPLGPIIVVADDHSLYLLEFVGRGGLEREIERLRQKTKSAIIPGTTDPILQVEKELGEYFQGKRKDFTTPIQMLGSPFQQRVWKELQKIPYTETRSYLDIAKAIDHPKAVRAVANANGANQLAILIPCHRVIQSSGDLGGYGGGVTKKKWLLEHERSYAKR